MTSPICPYYGSGYWNELPAVIAEINRRISGDPNQSFARFFQQQQHGRRFHRALFLNCGNGWVEREFFDLGIVDTAIGIDISEELLEAARSAAGDRDITYRRLNIDTDAFPLEQFDLIVNHAACHHMRSINRVMRACAASLSPDGIMLNYDYIGAHRNQYPFADWNAAWEANRTLPEHGRQDLQYPHLPTMLATDPSEAVHSELVYPSFRRYFSVDCFRAVGGAIAYPLLTFNDRLKELSPEEMAAIVERVIAIDHAYLCDHPASTLFAYWHGTPRRDVLADRAMCEFWQKSEDERERRAEESQGRYFEPTLLQTLLYPPV